MTKYGGGNETVLEKLMFGGVIAAMALLFVSMTQPAWRGKEMLAEMQSKCDQVGGVMLKEKKMFGTTYECAARLDR